MMGYLTRKTPRSSFMTNMFGMGADPATATTSSSSSSSSMGPQPGYTGIPFIPIPGFPTDAPRQGASTPDPDTVQIPKYALWGGVALLAYLLLNKR